jgi:hypothetical protein
MFFPAREIKPYAESICKEALVVGDDYYTVVFYDGDMTLPKMETLIYLGETTVEQQSFKVRRWVEGGGVYVFREVHAYHSEKLGHDFVFNSDELAGVYTFEAALEVLMLCALKRSEASKRS